MAISTTDLRTKTEMQFIIGESSLHEIYGLKDERLNRVDFYLAALMMSKYFSEEGNTKPWLFPQLLQVVREWRETYLTCKDNAFPQMLLLVAFAHAAAEKIYQAIVTFTEGARTLLPILRP